ncbi:MAG TPA: guanylate kinase [Methanosarcina sp.]|nr:guanylate kinase [Methanosarcina sp.]
MTVTGPSGSGKTELLKILCKNHAFAKLVSVTTRKPRPGEVEGEDYYFITEEQFSQLEKKNQLVQSVRFNGVSYGTTIGEMQRIYAEEKTPVVIVEPGGVDQFEDVCKHHNYTLISVFVNAQIDILIERMIRRMEGSALTKDVSEYLSKRLISLVTREVEWYNEKSYHINWHNNGKMTGLYELADYINKKLESIP